MLKDRCLFFNCFHWLLSSEEEVHVKTVGLISDTHIGPGGGCLPGTLKTVFSSVDMILHAGDITDPSVLDELTVIAPVTAVAGNMDFHPELRRLPARRILRYEGLRIGLIHGWGAPSGIHRRVVQAFAADFPDVIVHGHSHVPEIHRIGDCLIVNPGSPTDRRFSPYASVGILRICDGVPDAEIIRIGAYHGQ